MGRSLDNLIEPRGRLAQHQYAGWEPTRFAESGLGCTLDANVEIPLGDGVSLSADVYRPRKPGRYPAIVQIAAYNKERHTTGFPKGTNEIGSPTVLTDRGYVQVVSSRRGMGRSGGVSGPFFCAQEIDDYVTAIEWAARQPWCNGKVCLFGTSYYGMIQPMIAVRRPPALAAMFANEICTDFHRHLVAFGGSVNNRFFALWFGANFKDEDFVATMEPWQRAAMSQVVNRPWLWRRVIHPRIDRVYDGFLRKRPRQDMRALFADIVAGSKSRATSALPPGPSDELGSIEVPLAVVHNQGMFNLHQFGSFDLFERAGTSRDRKFLILGEAEYELPVLSWQLEALAFFDHVVKGCDNGYAQQPRVRYWVEATRRFEGADDLPIPGARRTRFYLAGDRLVGDPPGAGSRTWVAIPPSAPLPDGLDEVIDQRLDYALTSDTPLSIAGPITANLRFECNDIDSYVVACLARIDASGHRHVLSLGAIRPARRTIDARRSNACEIAIDADVTTPLTPGEPVTLRFSLVPTSTRVLPGERLVLQIASRTDRVRGRLADGYMHIDLEEPPYFSQNTLHHGADSYVELDVVSP